MKVLVLCTANSSRSQMAEGLFRQAGIEVYSAGTRPSHVRPEAIAVMAEVGIDISRHRSKSVDEFTGQSFEFVITVCDNANAECPVFPADVGRLHWPFDDPAAEGGEAAFRRIRDQIRAKVTEFVSSSKPDAPATGR